MVVPISKQLKTPEAYQVENYEAGSHFRTLREIVHNPIYTNETKKNIAQSLAVDPAKKNIQEQVAINKAQQAQDLEVYQQLKNNIGNDSPPEDREFLKKLKSKLEVGVTSKIFEGTVQNKLTTDINEGKLSFRGKNYTFVRKGGIPKSFEQMGVEVKDCKNWEEATVYLKELFAEYKDEFPELFKYPDWHDMPYAEMFPMINKWSQDHNIPYAGLQSSLGDRCRADLSLFAWLPVRVGGWFVCVCSDSMAQKARFCCGGGGDAYLSVACSD